MNHYATGELARIHIAELQREAANERLARAASSSDGRGQLSLALPFGALRRMLVRGLGLAGVAPRAANVARPMPQASTGG